MRLVVLGGTRFVGHAICSAAQQHGLDVVVFNRGRSGPPPPGALAVRGDRTWMLDLRELAKLIDNRGGADDVFRSRLLRAVARVAERADPQGRGAELRRGVDSHGPHSVARAAGGSVVPGFRDRDHAGAQRRHDGLRPAQGRCGTSGGDHLRGDQHPGRATGHCARPARGSSRKLPDYLRRAARGGGFVLGGEPGSGFQYVDVRDLADFMLTCAETGRPGRYDVVTRPGEYTWGDFGNAVARVAGGRPVFIDDQRLLEAGVAPWRGLPLWVPQQPDNEALWQVNGQAALEYGFAPPAAAGDGGRHLDLAAEGGPGLDADLPCCGVRDRSGRRTSG